MKLSSLNNSLMTSRDYHVLDTFLEVLSGLGGWKNGLLTGPAL